MQGIVEMKYLLVSVLFLLSACANNSTQKADANEIIADTIHRKVAENGENFTCKQPAMLTCLGISERMCLEEMTAVKPYCVAYANRKAPDYGSRQGMDRYLREFGLCMAVRQVMLHPEKNDSLNACLKGHGKPDADSIIKSLMAP